MILQKLVAVKNSAHEAARHIGFAALIVAILFPIAFVAIPLFHVTKDYWSSVAAAWHSTVAKPGKR